MSVYLDPFGVPMSDVNNSPVLVEGRDYTIENGQWVFTEHYHRTRGYCCENTCRHCPWNFGKPTSATADELS